MSHVQELAYLTTYLPATATKGSTVTQHPIEALIRASVAAVTNLTGENLTDVGRAIGLSRALISRRQRGELPWKIADLGRLADHWEIPACALISGPTDALEEMPAGRIDELRAAKGLRLLGIAA